MGKDTDLQSHAQHTLAEPAHNLHHHYIITLLFLAVLTDMMQEHTGYFELLGTTDNVLQHHGARLIDNTDLQSHALHTLAEPAHSLHHHYIITLLFLALLIN